VLARGFTAQKKLLEMAATDDEVIASWRDQVGTLRKRGELVPLR